MRKEPANRPYSVSTLVVLSGVLLLLPGCAMAQHMDHHPAASSPGPAGDSEMQDWAKVRLAKSPRHQEWVKVKNGTRDVNSFIVYPEVKHKATAVVVIHEVFGMTDCHGFMRAGDAPEPTPPQPKGDQAADQKAAEDYQKALTAYKANKKARDEAWLRWKSLLEKL